MMYDVWALIEVECRIEADSREGAVAKAEQLSPEEFVRLGTICELHDFDVSRVPEGVE